VRAAAADDDSPVPPPPRALRQTPSHLAASAQKTAQAAKALAEEEAGDSAGRVGGSLSEPRVYRNPAKEGVNRLRMKKARC
jgi:hypothetical protein